ncbi:MAG: SDR family NAD(P)-dependent oxidoreductase, partial [Thaumarchaeota archaeon]|nr:SDR family NAD(P)-dependent oxidoreductase [Nitrososphaerota archaeon]
MTFEGKSGIVTGGTGALGRAVTEAFVKAGARVAVPYIVDEEVQLLKSKLKQSMTRVLLQKADLFNESNVANSVGFFAKKLHRIDFLVNLVGGYFGGPRIAETDERDWDRMMRLNLKPTFLACKAVLPYMVELKYGRIVNIGSESGLRGEGTLGAYSVSKSGVLRLTETIADEYREYNIAAN